MNTVDLSAMLADHTASGAYYVDAGGGDALAEAAERLEFAFVRIDLQGCQDKEAVLARIAQALDFPDWFGRNWDALADCLDRVTCCCSTTPMTGSRPIRSASTCCSRSAPKSRPDGPNTGSHSGC